jgi:hypothetical protein
MTKVCPAKDSEPDRTGKRRTDDDIPSMIDVPSGYQTEKSQNEELQYGEIVAANRGGWPELHWKGDPGAMTITDRPPNEVLYAARRPYDLSSPPSRVVQTMSRG